MNANDVTFAFVRLQLTAATLGLKKDTIKGILLPLKHLHKQKVVKFSDTGHQPHPQACNPARTWLLPGRRLLSKSGVPGESCWMENPVGLWAWLPLWACSGSQMNKDDRYYHYKYRQNIPGMLEQNRPTMLKETDLYFSHHLSLFKKSNRFLISLFI